MTFKSILQSEKALKIIFAIALLVALIPVWQSTYFVTTDGPSHLYNSTVLKDLLLNDHTAFYTTFYELNTELEPNWLTHALYVLLLLVFPAFIAEKILITAYILTFAFGLKKLLKAINPKAQWLVILGLPLIYQRIFMMGFFNCTFSYVIFFFTLAYWLNHRKDFNWRNSLVLLLLLTLNYFTHPFGLALSLLSIAVIFVFQKRLDRKTFSLKSALYQVLKVTVAALPAIILIVLYLMRPSKPTLPLNTSNKVLFHQLLEADFLFNLNHIEKGIAIAVAATFGMALILGIVYWLKQKKWRWQDAFFFLFVGCLILYFNLPGYLAGGAFFVERMQFIIYLLLLLWVASFDFEMRLKHGLLTISAVVGSVLIIVRLQTYQQMSGLAEEIVQAADEIEDESTFLPIIYNYNGLTEEGELIANHAWPLFHVGDYAGTKKAIVSLTNYEANTGYFPLNYRDEINPYIHLGAIEGIPPSPDIAEYKSRTNQQIDYIMLICRDQNWKGHPADQKNQQALTAGYQKVFESEVGRVELYRLE